jgi:hypothetical protein
VFLIFPAKKIREQKSEKAPFPFGDETYGDIAIREGHFEHPGSFSYETYWLLKT